MQDVDCEHCDIDTVCTNNMLMIHTVLHTTQYHHQQKLQDLDCEQGDSDNVCTNSAVQHVNDTQCTVLQYTVQTALYYTVTPTTKTHCKTLIVNGG